MVPYTARPTIFEPRFHKQASVECIENLEAMTPKGMKFGKVLTVSAAFVIRLLLQSCDGHFEHTATYYFPATSLTIFGSLPQPITRN